MEFTVAITGASGSIYAYRTLVHLAASGVVERINLIMSESAETVARVELGVDLRGADAASINEWLGLSHDSKLVHLHRLDNLAAKPSSGSHPQEGMVIVPCSMSTLGRIATGSGESALLRAADVFLKERRKLIVVPRETPWNLIQARNVVTLLEAGAVVLPAIPSFYSIPKNVNDVVDTVVWRILDQLGLPSPRAFRWQSETARPPRS